MSKNTPFRYDYVGSFLRPETLKKARRDFEEGKISKEELTKVEDAAILDRISCDHRRRVQKSNLASGFYVGI